MTFDEFKASLSDAEPPSGLTPALQALWQEGKGNWDLAHQQAQQASSAEGDWVHAYLHRKEGDEGNASYWYARAGRKKPSCSLEAEWRQIAEALLV